MSGTRTTQGEKVYRIDIALTAYCHDEADMERLTGALADFADKDARVGPFECWAEETKE